MKIDVTTTATLRPEVVELTLWSFWRLAFKGHRVRLILNVDPVGQQNATQQDIVDIAKRYFPHLHVRTPEKPGYADAVKWLWSQVRTDFFWFVEDDYQLCCPIDLDKMLAAFQQFPDLALLRLPKGPARGKRCLWARPNGGHTATWNGCYYAGKHLTFTGMPSMIRTAWMRPFAKLLTCDKAIERQWRLLRYAKHDVSRGWRFGAFTEPDTPLTVRDIGTRWRKRMKISKAMGEFGFTGWLLNTKDDTAEEEE